MFVKLLTVNEWLKTGSGTLPRNCVDFHRLSAPASLMWCRNKSKLQGSDKSTPSKYSDPAGTPSTTELRQYEPGRKWNMTL